MSVKKIIEFEPTAVDQGQMREEEERRLKADADTQAGIERQKALDEEARRSAAIAEENAFKHKALDRKAVLTKEELVRAIPYMKARDYEMVTGTFNNLEAKGSPVKFSLHLYEGEDFNEWSFEDGNKYTVPYGVAWHLNNECYYLEYIELKDEFGRATGMQAGLGDGKSNRDKMQASKQVHRFQFLVPGAPADMYPSGLVEVSQPYR